MLRPLLPDDPVNIGPFTLHGRLGEGGMGVVFQGFGPDGAVVAIKMPHPQLSGDPEFRARFQREVSAARRVRGRRIAEVVAADIDAPRQWLANTFVVGESMTEAVRVRGAMTPAQLFDFASGLAEAIESIHAAGVVHRDLKPDNIILTWDGPRVIDFGIARLTDATRLTEPGRIVGTLAWMPPELLDNQEVGPPGDIFAWGALVAYAATGEPPFTADTRASLMVKIIRDEPDLSGVPGRYRRMVTVAMSKDPEVRPTASELVRFLVAQRRDEESGRRRTVPPVSAGPEPYGSDAVAAPDAAATDVAGSDPAVAVTSVAPTSVVAASAASRSVAPTSVAPTSVAPTSVVPTSVASPAVDPTSVAPTSVVATPATPPPVWPGADPVVDAGRAATGPPAVAQPVTAPSGRVTAPSGRVTGPQPAPDAPGTAIRLGATLLLSLIGAGLILGPLAVRHGLRLREHARRAYAAPPLSASRFIRVGWIAIAVSAVVVAVALLSIYR